MTKSNDENLGKSELQRTNELIHDEAFRALAEKSLEAHEKKIRQEAGNVNYEDMQPDVQTELVEIQVAEILLGKGGELNVYRLTSTLSTLCAKAALTPEVRGERLNLYGPPKRNESNPVRQMSVRFSRPAAPDPYKNTPEDIVVNTPTARVSIQVETAYLDNEDAAKFRVGIGVTVNFYEGGRAEVFGTKGTGSILYKTEEPIATLEEPEIATLMQRLPLPS